MKYIGEKYSLRPSDPLENAHADSFAQYTIQDVYQKVGAKIFSRAPERDAELQEAIDMCIPTWMQKLGETLPSNSRFLCGESLTIYDFTVAGLLTNLICNPSARDKEMWQKVWTEQAPERVQKYYEDFCEEMKDYLAERGENCTM